MSPLTDRSLITHGALTDSSLIDHVGKGREGKGSGREVGRLSSIGTCRRIAAARSRRHPGLLGMDARSAGYSAVVS